MLCPLLITVFLSLSEIPSIQSPSSPHGLPQVSTSPSTVCTIHPPRGHAVLSPLTSLRPLSPTRCLLSPVLSPDCGLHSPNPSSRETIRNHSLNLRKTRLFSLSCETVQERQLLVSYPRWSLIRNDMRFICRVLLRNDIPNVVDSNQTCNAGSWTMWFLRVFFLRIMETSRITCFDILYDTKLLYGKKRTKSSNHSGNICFRLQFEAFCEYFNRH